MAKSKQPKIEEPQLPATEQSFKIIWTARVFHSDDVLAEYSNYITMSTLKLMHRASIMVGEQLLAAFVEDENI